MKQILIPKKYGYVPIVDFFEDKDVNLCYERYYKDYLLSSTEYTDSEKLFISFMYDYEIFRKSLILPVVYDCHEEFGWTIEKLLEVVNSLADKNVLCVFDNYEDDDYIVVSMAYAYIRLTESLNNDISDGSVIMV